MNDAPDRPRVRTLDVLKELGFELVAGPDSGPGTSVAYDFGEARIAATESIDIVGRPITTIHGNYKAGRTLGMIEYNMPAEVESREQELALFAYALRGYTFANPPDWLTEGHALAEHLPWKQGARRNQPIAQCRVDRDWFRVARRKLRLLAEKASDDDETEWHFDGGSLRITAGTTSLIMPAQGEPWPESYRVPLPGLSAMPARFMKSWVSIEIRQDHMTINRTRIR